VLSFLAKTLAVLIDFVLLCLRDWVGEVLALVRFMVWALAALYCCTHFEGWLTCLPFLKPTEQRYLSLVFPPRAVPVVLPQTILATSLKIVLYSSSVISSAILMGYPMIQL
jgi:hypothetical protein